MTQNKKIVSTNSKNNLMSRLHLLETYGIDIYLKLGTSGGKLFQNKRNAAVVLTCGTGTDSLTISKGFGDSLQRLKVYIYVIKCRYQFYQFYQLLAEG